MEEQKNESQVDVSPVEKNDLLSAIVWAFILIWAGIVFLAGNLGWLETIVGKFRDLTGFPFFDKFLSVWPLVLAGMGAILLIEVILRLLIPAFRKPILGTLILGLVFLGIALDELIQVELLWPVVIIVIGLIVLIRGLRKK
jgi:hypothetical protein